MEIMLGPEIVLLTLILIIGGLSFYYLKLRNIQEMARIEHGLTTDAQGPDRHKKMGIMSIAIGLGVLSGYLIGKMMGVHQVVMIPSMILIIAGGALLYINQLK